MEMLDRIAVQLEDDHDAMFNTRLTCKTLEAAMFDRFADEFFHCPEYCVFNKRSLLHLQSLLSTSPRLAAKIRRITFTSSFFTNVNHTQVKLALNKSETNMDEAQIASIDAYNKQQYSMLHKTSSYRSLQSSGYKAGCSQLSLLIFIKLLCLCGKLTSFSFQKPTCSQ
jgi:hypothetical protein